MLNRRFNPSAAHKLEDPDRLNWLPPDLVLNSMNLRPGMNVADIGAGTGYFAIPMAKRVVPNGKIYAVDVEPQLLAMLKQKLAPSGMPQNLELIEGEADSTHLRDECADRVLLANIWHEIEDHAATLHEAKRILRKEGQIAILDWRPDVDPPPGPPLEHRIASAMVQASLRNSGWKIVVATPVGRYSYLVIATPPAAS